MDTMERERLKPSQDMVDMVMVDMVVDMADTDAATTVRGRLKPNQDTSPEAMATEAMAAMDTMERGRSKPSQDISEAMVDMVVDMVMAVDMAIMVKLYL